LYVVCHCAVHKRCHDKILGQCPRTPKDSRETQVVGLLNKRRIIILKMKFVSKKAKAKAFTEKLN